MKPKDKLIERLIEILAKSENVPKERVIHDAFQKYFARLDVKRKIIRYLLTQGWSDRDIITLLADFGTDYLTKRAIKQVKLIHNDLLHRKLKGGETSE